MLPRQNLTVLETMQEMVRTLRALADEAQQQPSEFSVPFLPFFRLGDVVRVLRTEGVTDVVVRYVSALPNLRYDHGQLTVASTGQRIAVSGNNVLQVGAGAMAQFRFSPINEFSVELDNPPGTDQWRTATQRFRVYPWLNALGMTEAEQNRHEVMSQFWVYEDTDPRFNFYPISAATHQVEMYLEFFGWKYDFSEVANIPAQERALLNEQIQRGDFRVVRLNGRPQ